MLDSKPKEPKLRFVADQMLRRLAKWLRLLGYDTLYFNLVTDKKLLKIAKDQKRVLLTRDTFLLKRREVKNKTINALYVEKDSLDNQLKQLIEAGLFISEIRPYCAYCNLPIETVDKEKVKDKVPPYVFQTQKNFGRCRKCNRIFWQGTHWQNIVKKASELKVNVKNKKS